MVGVTGLEPATSPPPAARATNCATLRYKSVLRSHPEDVALDISPLIAKVEDLTERPRPFRILVFLSI